MSRPFGSGFAASKSISESAASIGSDFLYPTAFIRRFSFLALVSPSLGDVPPPNCKSGSRNGRAQSAKSCGRFPSIRVRESLYLANHFPGYLHDLVALFHGISPDARFCRAGCRPRPSRTIVGGGAAAFLCADRAAGAAGGGQRLCRQDRAEPQPAA